MVRGERLKAIGTAALAGLLCSAAPAAMAQQAISTRPAQASSGISQEQALALTARLDALEQHNAELESQIDDLKKQVAGGEKQIRDDIASQPKVSLANGRPTFTSADGKFSASLRGVFQLDTAAYDQNGAGPLSTDLRRTGPALGASASNVDTTHPRDLKDGTLIRRARIGVDGTAFGDFDYRILFDFGGSGVENTGQLYEAWIQYNGLKPGRFKVGVFAPLLGLDDQASTNTMPFLERAAVSDMVRGLAGGDTRIAAQVFGYGDHWLAAGAVTGRTVGVLNTGTASAVPQTYGDQLGFTGRLAGTPFNVPGWLLHFGANGSYVVHPADTAGPNAAGIITDVSRTLSFSNTPELRVDGTKFINTGNIPAQHAYTGGLEFAAQHSNLLLQSEYQWFGVDRADNLSSPSFSGYYVSGSWMITGETKKYNIATAAFDGPNVAHPFSLANGGWGAWEAAARWSSVDLNYRPGAPGTAQTGSSIRGGDEQVFTVGVNWYWNAFARLMFDYQHVKIDRLSPGTSVSNAQTVWITPLGAQIGQSYNVVSVRSQLAF
jgi:phosphate-selective porin OprO/OprP